jgi:hypothetical protein
MRFTILFSVLLILASASQAAVPTTHITGTLYSPSGRIPKNASVLIYANASFTINDTVTGASGKHLIGRVKQTLTISSPSSVSLYIVPNYGDYGNNPDYTAYTVKVTSDLGTFDQIWQVPSSGSDVLLANIVVPQAISATYNTVPQSGGAFTGTVTVPSLVLTPMSQPTTNVTGFMYYDQDNEIIEWWTGSQWASGGGGGGGGGTVYHDTSLDGEGTVGSPLAVIPGGISHNSLANLTTGNVHTQYLLTSGGTLTGQLNCAGYQLKTAVLDNLASDPVSPVAGQVWLNTGTNIVKWRAGGVSVDPLSRTYHTGTQSKTTISDFTHASTHNVGQDDDISTWYLPKAGGTMSGALNMGGQQIQACRIENLASAPAPGSKGRIIYNTTTNRLMQDTGTAFTDLAIGGGAVVADNYTITGTGLVGSPLAVSTSNVTHNDLAGLTTGNPHTQYLLASGGTTLTGVWDLGSTYRISGSANPVADGDLVPLGYLNDGYMSYTMNSTTSDYDVGTEGRAWYNSTDHLLKWTDNVTVVNPLDRSFHTGTQSISTLSDLQATLDLYLPTAGGTMTGNLDLGNNQLTGAKFENVTVQPAAGNPGRVVYDTINNQLLIDDGSGFAAPMAQGSITIRQDGGADLGMVTTLDFVNAYVEKNGGVGTVTIPVTCTWANVDSKPSIAAGTNVGILGDFSAGENITIGVDSTTITPSYSNLQGTPDTFKSKIVADMGLALNAGGEAYVDSTAITPSYSNLQGVPGSFTPAAHDQAWSTITSRPSVSAGTNIGILGTFSSGENITIGVDSTTLTPSYSNLQGVPGSFTPSAHDQAWSTITSKPTVNAGTNVSVVGTFSSGDNITVGVDSTTLTPSWVNTQARPSINAGTNVSVVGSFSSGDNITIGVDSTTLTPSYSNLQGTKPKLDSWTAPDNGSSNLNSNSSRPGLCPQLSGNASTYLDGSGAFSTPAGSGGGGAGSVASAVDGSEPTATTTFSFVAGDNVTLGTSLSDGVRTLTINASGSSSSSGAPGTQYIDLLSLRYGTSAIAAPEQVALATTTGTNTMSAFAYDAAAEEGLVLNLHVSPQVSTTSNATLTFYWVPATAPNPATNCSWKAGMVSSASGGSFAGVSTNVTVSSSSGTSTDAWIKAQIVGTPSSWGMVSDGQTRLVLARAADEATDTLVGDALLVGASLEFTTLTGLSTTTGYQTYDLSSMRTAVNAVVPVAEQSILATTTGTNTMTAWSFDASAEESLVWDLNLPATLKTDSNATFNLYWAPATVPGTSADCSWKVSMLAVGADSVWTGAPTNVTVSSASGTATDTMLRAQIQATPSSWGWSEGQHLRVVVSRAAAEATDTLVGDAVLVGVSLDAPITTPGVSATNGNIGRGAYSGLVVTAGNGDTNAVTITALSITLNNTTSCQDFTSVNVSASFSNGVAASGMDVAGLDSSSVWRYGYVIGNASGDVAGLISASSTTPALPAGYIYWRRVCALRNDGSSNLIHTLQRQGYSTSPPIAIVSEGTATGWTSIDLSAVVPPTASGVRLYVYGYHNGGAGVSAIYFSPDKVLYSIARRFYNSASETTGSLDMQILSPIVYYDDEDANSRNNTMCVGWIDNL